MLYEWDENERLSNLKKHGFDFADAYYVFEDTQAVSFKNISKDFGELYNYRIYKKELCITCSGSY